MSNPWRVLGIPKGSDRSAIRRGYAKKLKTTNPEDNPEAFKKLREAYEYALQMASWAEYQHPEDAPEPTDEPEPDETPALSIEPQEPPEVRDPEAEELDQLVDSLESKLAGPWRNDAHAQNLLARIIDHAAMDSLDRRTGVEYRIGTLIAQHVPASDAILLDAIRTFEWDRVGRAEQWPFVAALERHEEWKLIAAFERVGHPFHHAWRALTTPPAFRWSRPLLAHSHHGPRIAQLLDIIDYQSNGLLPSTLPGEVAWWRARVERGTFSIAAYGWAAAAGVLVFALLWLIGAPDALAAVLALASFAIVAADRFGIECGYRKIGAWSNSQGSPTRTLWQGLIRFWPFAMAIVPFLALLLPATWAAAAGVLLVGAIALIGLRLSGDGQMTPLAIVWGSATLLVVTLALAAGAQLPPPLPRLVMLIAVGGLLVQPLIAARPVLLEVADAKLRNFGAFMFLAYATAFAATCWWAFDRGPADGATAAVLASLVLWVLSPLIAASHLMIANIASRIVRGLTFFIVLTMAGLLNPLSASNGMSNGEGIVALHLKLSREALPEKAAAMAEMRVRNPDLYRRIQRALPPPNSGNASLDRSIMAIDALIDEAVPGLVPVTSPKLAGRYQRAKIVLLYAIRQTDAAKCADGILQISPDLDMQARREISSILLAIAAHGRADARGNRLADLPRKADYDKAVEALRPTVEQTRVQAGVSKAVRDRCTDRIARAQALADLPDEAVAAVLGMPTVAARR